MKLQTILATATILSSSVSAQGPCIICPGGPTVGPGFEIVFPDSDGSGGCSTTCEAIISIAELYTSGTEDCDGLTMEVETFCCPITTTQLPAIGEEGLGPVIVDTPVEEPLPERPVIAEPTDTVPPERPVIVEELIDNDGGTPVPAPTDDVSFPPVAAVTTIVDVPVVEAEATTTTTAPIVAIQPDATPFPTLSGTQVATPTSGGVMKTLAPTKLGTEGEFGVMPELSMSMSMTLTEPTRPVNEELTASPSAMKVSVIPEATPATAAPVTPSPTKMIVPAVEPTPPTATPPTTPTIDAAMTKSAKLFKGDGSESSAKAYKTKAAKLLKSKSSKADPAAKSSKRGKTGKASNSMETISRPSTKSSKGTKSSKRGKSSKAMPLGANYVQRTVDHSYNGAYRQYSLGIVSVVVTMIMFSI